MDQPQQSESHLVRLAARLGEHRFFKRRFESLDRQTLMRPLLHRQRPAPVLAYAATWFILLGIAAFFVANIRTYLEWPPPAYSDAKAWNLTMDGVSWDTFYGEPVACGALDCQVTASYPAEKYTDSVVLPLRQFPLVGYQRGQTIYHRARIRLPERIRKSDELIVLHSVYIWAKSYEFYVNDQLVDTGSRSLLNIVIPPKLIPEDGMVTLAFKIDPGTEVYQGIAHYGDIVIGPRSLFADLVHTAREIRTAYFLWYLLPRLSLCVLFCFLFLAMAKNREHLLFCLFILTSSLKVFLYTEYADKLLPSSASGHGIAMVVDLFESLVFLAFVQQYFRRYSRGFNRALLGAFAVLGVFAVVTLSTGIYSQPFMKSWLGDFRQLLRLSVSAYATYLAAMTMLYLAHNAKSAARLKASGFLTLFLAGSTVVLSVEVARGLMGQAGSLGGIVGYTHELAICVVLAALVAMEFGWTITQRDQIRAKLRTVIDAKVADRMLENPAMLTGQSVDVVVLFSDIRAFTTLSETYPATEVVDMLNEYFEIMVGVINAHGGVVDKFIGDAIMATWGAPVPGPNDATAAAACAVEMRRRLREFNLRREVAGKFTIVTGIGLHCGRAIAGGIGSQQRFDYTIIGDTVNVAARVESLTKELQTDIVMTRDLFERISAHAVAASCGANKLKGKRRNIEVLRLIGIFDEAGRYHCHDRVYEERVQPVGPGLIIFTQPNVTLPSYTDVGYEGSRSAS